MKKIRLEQWPAELARQIRMLPIAVAAAGETIGEAAAEIARDKIGHYQPRGAFRAWAPLAESTVEQKTQAGYAPPDNPLLRTGEMRDSISGRVTMKGIGKALSVIEVGSTDPVALYQEMGTDTIPPRPFIRPAIVEVKFSR